MDPFQLTDRTLVTVDGSLDPSIPIVVLLHGLGGSSLDMTAPASAYPGLSFNRNATFSPYRDEGWNFVPPVLPVARVFLDPPTIALTSWKDALTAAGFTTLTYSQAGPTVAADVLQLGRLVTEALMGNPALMGLRVAFVAHSRGGIVARSFLVGAAANPALAAFMPRVVSLITLHSPHQGSGLSGAGGSHRYPTRPTPGRLRGAGPSRTGSPRHVCADLSSTRHEPNLPPAARLWQRSRPQSQSRESPTTPSAARVPMSRACGPACTHRTARCHSLYHSRFFTGAAYPSLSERSSTPCRLHRPRSSSNCPVVTEMLATLATLAAAIPELAPGRGDLLVADARAHLPFSTSRTTNPLNHLEALSDSRLQTQVIAILTRLRNPLVSGKATARLNPFPATLGRALQYTVAAKDAVTGVVLVPITVTVLDTYNDVLLTSQGPAPFTVKFTARNVRIFDGERHMWETERLLPSVSVSLGPPYGSMPVNTGLASD